MRPSATWPSATPGSGWSSSSPPIHRPGRGRRRGHSTTSPSPYPTGRRSTWADHLTAAGIDHPGIVPENGNPSLQLRDPDGTAVELVAPRPPAGYRSRTQLSWDATDGHLRNGPSLVALPLYIVIREYGRAAVTLAIILGTSAILKFTWYDHLAIRDLETNEPAADGSQGVPSFEGAAGGRKH